MLGYLKGQIGVLFRNKNFITKNQTASVHLRNLDLYIDAFVYREFKVIEFYYVTNKFSAPSSSYKQASK